MLSWIDYIVTILSVKLFTSVHVYCFIHCLIHHNKMVIHTVVEYIIKVEIHLYIFFYSYWYVPYVSFTTTVVCLYIDYIFNSMLYRIPCIYCTVCTVGYLFRSIESIFFLVCCILYTVSYSVLHDVLYRGCCMYCSIHTVGGCYDCGCGCGYWSNCFSCMLIWKMHWFIRCVISSSFLLLCSIRITDTDAVRHYWWYCTTWCTYNMYVIGGSGPLSWPCWSVLV